MYKKICGIALIICYCMVSPLQRCFAAPPFSEARPQYVFLNREPGPAWYQNNPETIADALFDEPIAKIGSVHAPGRRLGLSFLFNYLNGPPDKMQQTLLLLLNMATKHDTPILIGFIGENWWDYRSDLWNFWDKSKPGYNPDNSRNVEWTGNGPEFATKLAWRNWGRQIRVQPPPNLASPEFRKASRTELIALLKIVKQWADALPAYRKYLFPGVKVGSEVSVGINAFCYLNATRLLETTPADGSKDPVDGLHMEKGLFGGQAPQGYAALSSMGLSHPGEINRRDCELIASDYIRFLCGICRDAGFFSDQVFTHGGGQYAPWELHVSHSTAVNATSTPGWSLYNQSPATAGDLAISLTKAHQQEWCASEWLTYGTDSIQWQAAIQETLGFKRCRFLSIFNWEGIRKNDAAIEGIRRALAIAPDNR